MAQTDRHNLPYSSSFDFFVDGKINFGVVQRARVSTSTSGGQRCAAPREVGGTNDVTVSNRVNSEEVRQGQKVSNNPPLTSILVL